MGRLGKRLWQTLTTAQQRRVALLAGAVVVKALLEIVNVSAIAPFLALASDPSMIERNEILAFLYNFFGFTSVNHYLIAVGIGVFGLMLLSNGWSALTTWAQLRLVWSLNHQLSTKLLNRYLNRPYSYFLNRNTADLSKNLLSEVQQVTNQMIRPVVLGLGSVVVSVGVLTVLVVMNPLLAFIVAVIVGGSYGAVYAFVRKRLYAIGRARVRANRERFTVANEALAGIKDVKVLNVEESFLKRYEGPSYRYSRHQALSAAVGTLPKHLIETIAFGTVVLIVVYLISIESSFQSIVPMLGLYAFAGYRLMPALQQIFQGVTALRFNMSALEAVLEDLEDVPEAAPRPTGLAVVIPPMGLKKGLELRNVTFSYPNAERPAVKDVSLTIPANATVGFVGATGSGKTTLADIILGLLRPERGEIVVDGVPITEDNLSAWQTSIGYVPQHIFLTDASVSENIAFGVSEDEIDMEAVRRAARIAQIDDFVMGELPQQYDTIVGERGIRLSGGQRQRIGIARALYREPDVLVFDEATSALDNATEAYVMQAMRSLQGKKTLLLVAHRLTTLSDCDRIYELVGGHLVATGGYEQLRSREGSSAVQKISIP